MTPPITGRLPIGSPSIKSTADLGASGPLLVDVPGATPSHLVVAMGKDRNAYLVNRDNLGGISQPVAQLRLPSSSILQAAATYRTEQGTYVAFRANKTTIPSFPLFALLQRIRPPSTSAVGA